MTKVKKQADSEVSGGNWQTLLRALTFCLLLTSNLSENTLFCALANNLPYKVGIKNLEFVVQLIQSSILSFFFPEKKTSFATPYRLISIHIAFSNYCARMFKICQAIYEYV